MNVEKKLQIDVIKGERIYFKDLEDMIFVADGHVGVYLKDQELKINRSKMIEMGGSPEFFKPHELKERCIPAKETHHAVKTNRGYAIKIKAIDSDEYCYISENYLKMFKGYTSLMIKGKLDPVLIFKYGLPYGIILPIRIKEE